MINQVTGAIVFVMLTATACYLTVQGELPIEAFVGFWTAVGGVGAGVGAAKRFQ